MKSSKAVDQSMPNFAPLRRSIIISVILPAIAIQILTRSGVPILQSIVWSSVFPVAELALDWRRSRRIDAIAVLSIVVMVVSLATSALNGDARFALVKDSAFTAIAGITFLTTLLLPRPLIFFVSRSYMAGATAEAWEARWQSQATFRTTMRVMTAVWGCGLLSEAIARVVIAWTLPASVAAGASGVLALAVFGGLILWTLAYIRWVRQQSSDVGPLHSAAIAKKSIPKP